jgi:hypothetical protein
LNEHEYIGLKKKQTLSRRSHIVMIGSQPPAAPRTSALHCHS